MGARSFIVLYVEDILLVENENPDMQNIGELFCDWNLGIVAYVLNAKIYTDRSRSLIAIILSTYIDKVLIWFSMKRL